MNILHYTIGLPPERHGGSVQYANDLIQEQSRNYNVTVLKCGDTLLKPSKTKFKYSYQRDNIKVYSLTNPLTPTLIYGTSDPQAQHKSIKIDFDNIRKFILDNNIDVLHMHTLMGMHKDIIKFIKDLGVKIFYTTHDFHGICPHYNLLDFNGELCKQQTAERCSLCNSHEPSEFFLRLANSSLYQGIKNYVNFNNIWKSKKVENQNIKQKYYHKDLEKARERTDDYNKLIEYYKDYFNLFDKIHFNSSQSKEIFTSFIPAAKGEVINVITSGIKDKRKLVTPGEIINIGFVGSLNAYKGFPMLKQALLDLKENGIENIHIKVYGSGIEGIDKDCSMIKYCPSYKYEELSDILYHLDGTIVPSKWYETFSLVTLESLAHGRPVFVSDHVGAKDIVSVYDSQYIFSSQEQLKNILRRIALDRSFLKEYSQLILDTPWPFSIKNHVKDIIKFYND